MKDRAAEREPLTPPTGEIARERVLAAGQAGHLEHETAPFRETRRVEAVHAAKEANVLVDGQQLVEREALRHVADALLHALGIGRHVDAPDRSAARCRPQQAAEHANRRGLAGAVAAEKAEDLAAPDVERQSVDGHERAEPAREIPDLDRALPVAGGLDVHGRRHPWSAADRPREPGLGQSRVGERPGAIELGLQQRGLGVEHLGIRHDAGVKALGDDATRFGGGADAVSRLS